MSVYEYWIGRNVDLNAVWRDYEEGAGYERKFRQTTCHLLEIEFETPPASDPLFAFEAVFKTTKRYFHDMKQLCLSPREYDEAAPLYFYGVGRGSAIWQWLGELRQLILFGTTLSDEKVVGQIYTNDATNLGQRLSGEVSKSSAVEFSHSTANGLTELNLGHGI